MTIYNDFIIDCICIQFGAKRELLWKAAFDYRERIILLAHYRKQVQKIFNFAVQKIFFSDKNPKIFHLTAYNFRNG
jgi:hypothetical protein